LRAHQDLLASHGLSESMHNSVNRTYQQSSHLSKTGNQQNDEVEQENFYINSQIFQSPVHNDKTSLFISDNDELNFDSTVQRAYSNGLTIIEESLLYTVTEMWNRKKSEFLTQGCSVNDIFFSEVIFLF
jgi:hypothetical protein